MRTDTPRSSRAYALPSCGACLRIAERRGFSVGIRTDEGIVEAFTHTAGHVHALVVTPESFVLPLPIETLENRRASCL